MHNDLIPYATGEVRPRRQDRELVSQARGVYDKVRLAALEADAAMALGAHIMEGTTQLDAHRRALAGNNEQLNAVLCEIELSTIRQAQTIQRQAFNRFGSKRCLRTRQGRQRPGNRPLASSPTSSLRPPSSTPIGVC